MKRFLLFPVTLLLCFQLSGQRGTIVSTFPMATLSPEEIMLNLKNNLDGTAYTLAGLFIYQKYSVTAVKVIYKTINGKGQPT
ncbi:MAG TPA: hypothetical protein PLZ75_07975, partial [Bacteroidales bacterium]|nr:hypothetical protein [Bacteroidales bacterium]